MYKPDDDTTDLAAVTEKTVFLTVVGVVAEMKLRNLTDGDNLVGAYFFPLAQAPQDDLTFEITAAADPGTLSGALRHEIAAVDSQLPVFEMQPMSYWTDRSLAKRRSPALLSIAFGFVALFLSAIGIYGVLAYLVTQRTKEIGIRVALGAAPRQVQRLVLRDSLIPASVGCIVGTTAAAWLTRAIVDQLFGVSALDPTTFTIAPMLLVVVAAAASWWPARRAMRVNPTQALRA